MMSSSPPPIINIGGDFIGAVIIKEQGSKLTIKNGQLICSKNHLVLATYPIDCIDQLIIFGNIQLTTQLMKYAMESGFDVAFISIYHKLVGWIQSEKYKGQHIRLKQYQVHLNQNRRLQVAKEVALEKCKRQLAYAKEILANQDVKAIQVMGTLNDSLLTQPKYTLQSIRGIEGMVAKHYFPVFFGQFGFDWHGDSMTRRQQSKINSLLNLTYALLENELVTLCSMNGLDPCIGFLHDQSYGRKSLIYDLMEYHRVDLADRFVAHIITKSILTCDDFTYSDVGYRLNESTLGVFFGHWHRWVNDSNLMGTRRYDALKSQVVTFKEEVIRDVDSEL